MNCNSQSVIIHFDEDPSIKNAQGIAITMHEALLLMIFLQLGTQTKKK